MSKLLDRTTLLFALGFLLIAKFVLAPVFEWQSSLLLELDGKGSKLSKMSRRIDKTLDLTERREALEVVLLESRQYFYDDDDDAKLLIQTKVEEIFAGNKVEIERFSWVLDDLGDGAIRTARALVGFKGDSDSVIRSLLSLSNDSKLVKIHEIRQRFIDKTPTILGSSRGQIVVEFYLIGLSADATKRKSEFTLSDMAGVKSYE